ncbi:MAG: arginine repressor [Planctomycetes bacterium]|nr:arginine repressor [Planctomycetota bacterium]
MLKHLRQKGIKVTQATLSRDIQEMSIVLVPGPNGRHYQLPAAVTTPVTTTELNRRFGGYVTDIKHNGSLIVVKTLPGEASGTARIIDGLNMPGVLGTIAGDDTFLIVAKNKQAIKKTLSVVKPSTHFA